MQLKYHNAAKNRATAANLLGTKYFAILHVELALLSRAFAIDQEAHAILIRNRITILPDRTDILLDQVLANLWGHYGIADKEATTEWETFFDTPRELNNQIMNFFSPRTISQIRFNNADRPFTNHYRISIFKMDSLHDPPVKLFMAKLKQLYPGDQISDQLLDLAGEQNLDCYSN